MRENQTYNGLDTVTMTRQYIHLGCSAMNRIEDNVYHAVGDVMPRLEAAFFKACDEMDLKRLKFLLNQLNLLADMETEAEMKAHLESIGYAGGL